MEHVDGELVTAYADRHGLGFAAQATRREVSARLPTVADLLADLRALSRHAPTADAARPWDFIGASVLGGVAALAVAAVTRRALR